MKTFVKYATCGSVCGLIGVAIGWYAAKLHYSKEMKKERERQQIEVKDLRDYFEKEKDKFYEELTQGGVKENIEQPNVQIIQNIEECNTDEGLEDRLNYNDNPIRREYDTISEIRTKENVMEDEYYRRLNESEHPKDDDEPYEIDIAAYAEGAYRSETWRFHKTAEMITEEISGDCVDFPAEYIGLEMYESLMRRPKGSTVYVRNERLGRDFEIEILSDYEDEYVGD